MIGQHHGEHLTATIETLAFKHLTFALLCPCIKKIKWEKCNAMCWFYSIEQLVSMTFIQ